MSLRPPVTRLTLFVPGNQSLADGTVHGEWIENPGDGSFGESFPFGTVDKKLRKKIDSASGSLLVELPDDLLEGRQRVLAVVKQVQRKGAIAVRIEQSKLGWSVDHWVEVLSAGYPVGLHRSAVIFLPGENEVRSCGMHAFSLPDARVELDAKLDAEKAQHLLSALNVYQIAEAPLLLSGQRFSPDSDAPRRPLQRWPDSGFPPEHWCHNPYGVWHLGPARGRGRSPPDLHAHFTPSLVATLMALDAKEGPLTRKKVEEARDRAPCVAIRHEDAAQLERTRGYADIDPELAWEQWQVVAANRSL